jgi:hypothetical protein
MLRSAGSRSRTRWWNHNRADNVLRVATVLVEEKGHLKFLSVLRVAAAIAALGIGASSSLATIVAVAPDVVLFTPTDVTLNQTESDVQIIAFDENQCVLVTGNGLETDQGIIPAGTKVSSHFVHMDPVNGGPVLDGKVRFDTDIIAVISSSALLDDSDVPYGLSTVLYPAPGVEPYRGLEAFQANDRYQIIQAGRAIHVQMDVPSYSDQLRVITCCPGNDNCD